MANSFSDAVEARLSKKPAIDYSENVRKMSKWILGNKAHGGKSFGVVDKKDGSLITFDPEGNPTGRTTSLTGRRAGDTVITDGGVSHRTPSGEFSIEKYASEDYGPALRFHRVGDNNFLVHATARHSKTTPYSVRKAAYSAADPSARRCTSGCVNVEDKEIPELYKRLDEGSKLYVLPETKEGLSGFRGFQEALGNVEMMGPPAIAASASPTTKDDEELSQSAPVSAGKGPPTLPPRRPDTLPSSFDYTGIPAPEALSRLDKTLSGSQDYLDFRGLGSRFDESPRKSTQTSGPAPVRAAAVPNIAAPKGALGIPQPEAFAPIDRSPANSLSSGSLVGGTRFSEPPKAEVNTSVNRTVPEIGEQQLLTLFKTAHGAYNPKSKTDRGKLAQIKSMIDKDPELAKLSPTKFALHLYRNL